MVSLRRQERGYQMQTLRDLRRWLGHQDDPMMLVAIGILILVGEGLFS